MNAYCTIQLFADGAWRDDGSVSLLHTEVQGWRSKTYSFGVGMHPKQLDDRAPAFEHSDLGDARLPAAA